MKTAMQELIEYIELNIDDNDFIKHEVLEQADNLIEKEKEQSINLIKQTCMFMGASIIDIEISKMEFEDIYNNYYNQNK